MIKKTLLVVCLLFYSFWSYDYFSFSKKEYDKLTLPTINWDLLRFWEISEAKALSVSNNGGTLLTFSDYTNFDFLIEEPIDKYLNYNQLFDDFCGFTVTSITKLDNDLYTEPSCNSETSHVIAFLTLFTGYARESGDNSDCYLISHDGSSYSSNKTTYNACALAYGDDPEPANPLIAMIWQLFNTLLSVLPFALASLLTIAFTYWSFQKVLELFNAYKTVRQDRNDFKMLNPDNVKKKEAIEQLKRIVNPKTKKDFYK